MMKRIEDLQKTARPRIRGRADIVICLDVTGSMQPVIDGVKNNLKSLVEGFSIANDSIKLDDWRIKLLPFRDIDVDRDDALKLDFPFVDNVEDFAKQLESVSATGGGDEPEDSLTAIYAAITKTPWDTSQPRLHAIVLITDAPPKEKIHTSYLEPGEDSTWHRLIELILKDKTMRLWIFAPQHEIFEQMEKKAPQQIIYEPFGKDHAEAMVRFQKADFSKLLKDLGATITLTSGKAY